MKVVFERQINCENGWINLTREEELPFIPRKGHHLSFCPFPECCTGLIVIEKPVFHVPTLTWHVKYGREHERDGSFEHFLRMVRHLIETGWEPEQVDEDEFSKEQLEEIYHLFAKTPNKVKG